MTTLTERILSRWTGTGVRCKYVNYDRYFTLDLSKPRNRYCELLLCGAAKLLLRPNSDLTKEITHNGETFVPMVRLLELFANKRGFPLKGSKFREDKHWILAYSINSHLNIDLTIDVCTEDFESNPAWILNQLHEWHFACGLDESLWIDLNTVEEGNNV